jgi:secreted PhoX family phosphatase
MSRFDRREFLRLSGLLAGTAALGFSRLQALAAVDHSHTRLRAGLGEGGYGPLRPAGPDLALPDGFQYRRFGDAGSLMSDGHVTPLLHDGMAAFPLPNGNIRLVRNHEVAGRGIRQPTFPQTYDAMAGGGTTSLEVDPVTRELVADFTSLDGTVRNCAGGPTPWGSWLSCEETTMGVGVGLQRPHGYVFDVPAAATGPVAPVPLRAMGRFVHEAVAADPRTGIVYETEDQYPGGFYRFLPDVPYRSASEPGDLTAGGRLQMLAIDGRRRADLSRGQDVDRPMAVRWVDIEDPDPREAEAIPAAVWSQGRRQGGAAFSRCEGAWYADGAVYFSCTDGGDAGEGQVWVFRPGASEDGGTLTLLFESPDARVLHNPDNVCVSPRGAIVLCEDGGPRQFVRGLTPEGLIFDFVENLASTSEIAGATFSPDGQTLFFNLQNEPGATYAVWGPWQEGAL